MQKTRNKMKRNQLKHTLSLDDIATTVCKYFNLSIDEVFIKNKKGNFINCYRC